MTLKETIKYIKPINEDAIELAKKRWMTIAKPLFSLGKLETAVIQMAGIKGTPEYTLHKKGVIIMCADNGVVEEGVTQTGQEVTAIVANNFTEMKTSVCIMAKEANADIYPVDIGVAVDVPSVTRKDKKVAYGTKNMAKEPAMTKEQVIRAVEVGIQTVQELKEQNYDILATGEMGIGNTTTSSAIASLLLHKTVEAVTGKGAGLTNEGLKRKIEVIKKSIALNCPDADDPLDVLAKVGGLDIAGLAGVFLGGACFRVPIVADGFISMVAALVAVRLAPLARDYILPSHVSKEPAAQMLFSELQFSPFLTCDMCLGEGTGAVAVLPLLNMGVEVYRQMSTFEEITIDNYEVLQ